MLEILPPPSTDLQQQQEEVLDDVNDSLLKLLACPSCRVTCTPPIYMCVNWHSVCRPCAATLTECPTCLAPGAPDIRNIFAEQMSVNAKRPCANARDGCKKVLNLREMSQHLIECNKEFSYRCLVFVEVRVGTLCDWVGTRKDLIAHVREEHPECYSEEECVETRVTIFFNRWLNRTMLVAAHGQLFWVELMYNHVHTRTYLWAYYVGSAKNCQEYECSFELSPGDGRLKFNCVSQVLRHGELIADFCGAVVELGTPFVRKFMDGPDLNFTSRIVLKM